MCLFNSYITVDWSSANNPSHGKDSIWYCHVIRGPGGIEIKKIENPPTRSQAINEIHDVLLQCLAEGLTTLIGFDFAYGYPTGFSSYLKLDQIQPWLSIWREIHSRIEDSSSNKSNRFNVAAELNREISEALYPFWGHHQSLPDLEYLKRFKPQAPPQINLNELRITEEHSDGAQSAWQLFGLGSVGGQVLTGIPRLYSLYMDKDLNPSSIVWPFDTGLCYLSKERLNDKSIIHAEIYPSIIDVMPNGDDPKDKAQVRELALYFTELDKKGELGSLFSGSSDLSDEQRRVIEREEGWILGVM